MKTGRILTHSIRELGKNKPRTFFMMIGIVIGVTTVTLVLSAGLGARRKVMERVRKFGLNSLMVSAGGGREMGGGTASLPVVTLKADDAEAIKHEIRAVKDTAPFNRKGDGMLKYREKSYTTRVFGVTPSWQPVWDWYAEKGNFISDDDHARMNRVCVIAPTVQQELFGEADPIGEQIRIGTVPFEIIGIMEPKGISPGGGDMDNRVYIPLSTFSRRIANVDHITNIKVLLRDRADMNRAVEDIRSLLRGRHSLAPGVPDDFRITTPVEVTRMAERVSGTFSLFLVLVAAVSLVAGGFVITNIMLISIGERRREIGLRMAVGARARDIRNQFLVETITITVFGGLAGIVIGIGGAFVMEVLTEIPVAFSWHGAALGLVFSALVGLAAGVHPAKRAAAIQPVEALSKQG
ncbi:MAG TPA: FtsX-like permease family protein [bacterium]|nr:FtsX-like permease family protein [bacterium]